MACVSLGPQHHGDGTWNRSVLAPTVVPISRRSLQSAAPILKSVSHATIRLLGLALEYGRCSLLLPYILFTRGQ